MKITKVFMFAVIGLSAVVLGGCLKKDNTASTGSATKEKIADAFKSDRSTYCVIGTTGGSTIETWTKGEKVKTYGGNMGGGAGMGYMISDGQWTYLWVEGSTKGSKYPVENEETPRSEGEALDGEMTDIDVRQEVAKYQVEDFKQDCSEKDIPDSTFVPPTNVTFVDVMEEMGIVEDEWSGGGGNSLEDFKQE